MYAGLGFDFRMKKTFTGVKCESVTANPHGREAIRVHPDAGGLACRID
jgi:hypothetical protein